MTRANLGALAAAVLFGLAAVAVRVAVQDLPPTSVAVYRYGQGALILLIALAAGAPRLLRVRPRDLAAMAALGLLYFTLFPLAYNSGLRLADVSRASLMLATVPLWSALLARRSGECLDARQVVGLVLSLAGVATVLTEQGLRWDGGVATLIGCALVLLAAVFVALYGVAYHALARRSLRRYPPLTITVYAMAFGTAFTMPAAVADGFVASLSELSGPTALAILYLGVFGGAVAITLWTAALKHLTPTRVAAYLHLNPIVATLAGTLLLGETVSAAFVASFAVVVLGVVLVNAPAASRAAVAVRRRHARATPVAGPSGAWRTRWPASGARPGDAAR